MWSEKLSVCNKSIIKGSLTLNHHFSMAKIPVIINEKVHLLLFSHMKIHWHICLDSSKQWLICAYFSPDSDKMTFHWRNQYYGLVVFKPERFQVKNIIKHWKKHFVLLHKMLTDGLELCGLLVDNCDVFISCLVSHSDGTHLLQRIHCKCSLLGELFL